MNITSRIAQTTTSVLHYSSSYRYFLQSSSSGFPLVNKITKSESQGAGVTACWALPPIRPAVAAYGQDLSLNRSRRRPANRPAHVSPVPAPAYRPGTIGLGRRWCPVSPEPARRPASGNPTATPTWSGKETCRCDTLPDLQKLDGEPKKLHLLLLCMSPYLRVAQLQSHMSYTQKIMSNYQSRPRQRDSKYKKCRKRRDACRRQSSVHVPHDRC